jgi:hypothetical protein
MALNPQQRTEAATILLQISDELKHLERPLGAPRGAFLVLLAKLLEVVGPQLVQILIDLFHTIPVSEE